MSELVWIAVIIKQETDLAILVDHGTEDNEWIPKSQVSDQSEDPYQVGDSLEIEIPEWLALEKDMI